MTQHTRTTRELVRHAAILIIRAKNAERFAALHTRNNDLIQKHEHNLLRLNSAMSALSLVMAATQEDGKGEDN